MHEMPVVKDLLNAAIDKARGQGAIKITKIFFSLGESSGLSEGCIRHYFSECSQTTIAEDARLYFRTGAAKIHCRVCGLTAVRPDFLLKCPRCGQRETVAEPYRDIAIENIEIAV